MRRLAIALLILSAPVLAQVPAEYSGDAVPVEFAVRGAPHKHLRMRAGGTLRLQLTGPGQIGLDLREEALAPRQEAYVLEMDGKAVAPQQLNTALDASARSEKGLAVSRPMVIPVVVPAGTHALRLQWPTDAAGDVLVMLTGATLIAPLPDLALPPLPGSPVASAAPGRNEPPPLALPGAKPSGTATATAKPTGTATGTATAKPTATATTNATPNPNSLPSATPNPAVPLAPLTGPATQPPAKLSSETRPRLTAAPGEEASAFHLVTLDIRAGADRSSESYTGPVALGRIGGQVTWFAMPLLPVMLDFDLGFSRQQYQVRQLAGDGRSLASTELDERRFDTVLAAGYELGPWLRRDGRLSAVPFLGAQYSAFRNGGFPLDLFGVAAGANGRWALSPSLALQSGVRWTYNLLKGSTLSAVGTPVSDLLLTGGISLPLSGGYAFDVGYRGDVLSLHYDTRVSHGLQISLRAGL